MDKQINLSLLSLIILIAGVFITNQLTQQGQERRVKAGSAAPCEDPRYCYDRCSRKPDVANPDEVCLRQHPNFPSQGEGCLGCEFPPPACCEVMAQTGNAGACCHYPEYNWCRPEQCAKVTFFPKGEANYDPAICGGAWRHYCANKAPTQIPSSTSTPVLPTSIEIPSPTPTSFIIPTVLPPSPTVWPTPTVTLSIPIATPTPFPTAIAPSSTPTAVATFTPTPTPSFTMENYLQKIFSGLRFFLTAILP